jgi:hypothetical protein
MAPEQVVGGDVDARSDLYSLAVVLYELFVGRPPFQAASAVLLMSCHIKESPCALREAAPDRGIPEAAEAAILKALEKDPNHRFADATEMRQALEAVLAPYLQERRESMNPTPQFSDRPVTLDATADSPHSPEVIWLGEADVELSPCVPDIELHLTPKAMSTSILESTSSHRKTRRRRPMGWRAMGALSLLISAGLMALASAPMHRPDVAQTTLGAPSVQVVAMTDSIEQDQVQLDSQDPNEPPIDVDDPFDPEDETSAVMGEMTANALPNAHHTRTHSGARHRAAMASSSTESVMPLLPLPEKMPSLPAPSATHSIADAETAMREADPRTALTFAREATRNDDSVHAIAVWAHAAFAAGEFAEAHSACEKWLAHDKTSIEALIMDSRALRAMGRVEQASAQLKSGLTAHPGNHEIEALLQDFSPKPAPSPKPEGSTGRNRPRHHHR